MKALVSAARRSLESAGLWREDARLLCAVSGGADGVALLHALVTLRKEMPFVLCAIHIQHGLRGEASLLDEQFVRELCGKLGVPLSVRHAGLSGDMHTPGVENRARDCRRKLFLQEMAEKRLDAVLVAHHRDDQAETVLMHLLRGAGADGLRGMQACQPFGPGWLLRPFLSLSRRELRQALGELPYREDASNAQMITARNTVRLSVLPQLEALFPGAAEHIAQAARVIGQDAQCLDAQARERYQAARYAAPPLFMLDVRQLRQTPEAIFSRVLRLWWTEGLALAGLSPKERTLGHADTQALMALAEGDINLPCGLKALSDGRWMHLLHQSGEALQPAPFVEEAVEASRERYDLPGLTVQKEAGGLPTSASEAVIPPEILAQGPVFRYARPNDRIRPMGAPGAKPFRRWLTDRKISPVFRPAVIVLALENEVLWVPGLCTAQQLCLSHIPNGSVRLVGALDFCKS